MIFVVMAFVLFPENKKAHDAMRFLYTTRVNG